MLKRYEANANFATRIDDRESLSALLPQWEHLAEHSAEDNVYFEPNYALSLLDTVEAHTKIKFVTVWSWGALIAFLPVVTKAISIPGVAQAGRAWLTDYTFACTPLLDRNHILEAAHGIIEGLTQLKRGEWVLPQVNADGVVCKALSEALEYRGHPCALREPFQRASIRTGTSFETHMQLHVCSKRRRELARNRRRLEEVGSVSFHSHTCGESVDLAVEEFLRIEASGWKGKRGTALACNSATADFARKAFGRRYTCAKSRVDLLLVNQRPIAAGVIVFSGNTGFTVKGGYDEQFASYSAGLQLEVEVIRSFLTEKWASRLDAATNGSHVVDGLWPDRMNIADLAFSLSPIVPRLRISAYHQVQELKSSVKRRAKKLLGRA